MQSNDSRETYAYGKNNDIVRKKEDIKFKNMIKKYKNR